MSESTASAESEWMTIDAVCEALSVSRSFVRRLCNEGYLDRIYLGGTGGRNVARVSRASYAAYIKMSREHESKPAN